MSINQALCNHGLESWIIRPEEECTLAKISILYQLANGCLEYTAEFRRLCFTLGEYVKKRNLDGPELSKFVDIGMKQFTDRVVVEAILQSKDVSDKYARLGNFIAREVVALYPYLGQ